MAVGCTAQLQCQPLYSCTTSCSSSTSSARDSAVVGCTVAVVFFFIVNGADRIYDSVTAGTLKSRQVVEMFRFLRTWTCRSQKPLFFVPGSGSGEEEGINQMQGME